MDDFLSGLMMVGAIVQGSSSLRLSGYFQGANARINTSAQVLTRTSLDLLSNEV